MTRRERIAAERLATAQQHPFRRRREAAAYATGKRSVASRTGEQGNVPAADVAGAAFTRPVPTVRSAIVEPRIVAGRPAGQRDAANSISGLTRAARRRTSAKRVKSEVRSATDAAPARPAPEPRSTAAGSARATRQAAAAATVTSRVAAAPTAPGRLRRTAGSFRSTASKVTGASVILFVAGLVVSTSLPAQAFYTQTQVTGLRAASSSSSSQSLSVGKTADGVTSRDGYSVTEVEAQPVNTSDTFTNDPNGTIQWPFAIGVPISSGFGARNVEGCSFCSTFHEGVDFAPGAGTAIGSIAAGTVIKVQANDGGYGNDVWVQHNVDGKEFISVYGHMLDNSFAVSEGEQVAVGQELGLVGSTGNSTGPHLHLEIHVDGVPVDPLAWLTANAN